VFLGFAVSLSCCAKIARPVAQSEIISADEQSVFWLFVKTGNEPGKSDLVKLISEASKTLPDPESEFVLGYLGFSGVTLELTSTAWLHQLQLSASAGYPPAEAVLAQCYYGGYHVRMDRKLGESLMDQAISRGDPLALCIYGSSLAFGEGQVVKDVDKAKSYLNRAAKLGYCQAQVVLAMLLADQGEFAEARKIVIPLADANQMTAECVLATWYINGTGVPRDEKKGFDVLKDAVKRKGYQHCAEALNLLASLYERGIGTPPSLLAASKLYDEAYIEGSSEAGIALVRLCVDENSGQYDTAKARRILADLSKQGSAIAETYLGSLLLDGSVFPGDPQKAIVLLSDASSQGDKNASDLLELAKKSAGGSHVKIQRWGKAVKIPAFVDGAIYYFLLDTGSDISFVDTNIFTALPKEGNQIKAETSGGSSVVPLFKAPSVTIAGMKLNDAGSVAGLDLAAIQLATGENIAGGVGMDLLKNYVVQFDYDEREVRLQKPDNLLHPDWGNKYQLSYTSSIPKAYVNLDEKTRLVTFDSGLEGDVVLPDDEFILRSSLSLSGCFSVGSISVSGTSTKKLMRLPVLQVGTEIYHNILISNVQNSRDYALGIGFFERNMITFDFPHHQVFIKSNSERDHKAPQSIFGFAVNQRDKSFFVQTIDPGGPAMSAGLQVGDQISKINGEAAESVKFVKLNPAAHPLLQLHIKRNGVELDIIVRSQEI